jgi:PPP family 3-phenylpropionic acid transporter
MHGHPRVVLPAYYLTHFAFVGLFVPYFGIYLRTLGFSDTRIGILLALIPLAKAVLPGAWGAAADHWDIRRHLMIFSTWAAFLAFTGFLTVTSFAGCLLVMAVFAAMAVPPLPFVEATTLEYVHTSGRDYGRIRVFGSIGFALLALLYGRLAGDSTAALVVPAALVVLAVNAMVTSFVPAPASPRRTARLSAAQILSLPGVSMLLAAGFLMQASHGAYLGFFSLVLEERGYSGLGVGLARAGAIAAEVMVMLISRRLVTGLGIRRLMALSVAVAAFRWFLYAGSVAVPVLILGQTLHAFTYAGFHVAAVQTIQRLIPAGSRSTGQAFYSGWTFGAGIMAGTLYSGIVKDYLGTGPMFVSAGFMALASLAILLLGARLRPATVRA